MTQYLVFVVWSSLLLLQILGLGIDIPGGWARGGVLLVLSHPGLSLASGLLLLVVFGWGIWKLLR